MSGHLRVLPVVAVLGLAAMGAACGDDGGGDDPSDAVASLVEASFPDEDVTASCPDATGGRFTCEVTVGEQQVSVPVEDDDGDVQLRAALVDLGEVERMIETRYDEDEGVAASAECSDNPDDSVRVAEVGDTFRCAVEPSSGTPTEATVTVDDMKGAVSIDL